MRAGIWYKRDIPEGGGWSVQVAGERAHRLGVGYFKQMKRVTSKRNRITVRSVGRRAGLGATARSSGSNHKGHGDNHLAHRSASRAHARVVAASRPKVERPDPQYLAAIKTFELAVRYFRKRSFGKARQVFTKLVASPYPEVADRAKLHLRLCERRKSSPPTPALKSAQDYYILGVAELNARQLDSALERLNKADRLEPNRDHVHYALAAAHALQGNTDAALQHLKLAVTLRSQNGFQARGDDDFRSLASDPRFQRLVASNGSRIPSVVS